MEHKQCFKTTNLIFSTDRNYDKGITYGFHFSHLLKESRLNTQSRGLSGKQKFNNENDKL